MALEGVAVVEVLAVAALGSTAGGGVSSDGPLLQLVKSSNKPEKTERVSDFIRVATDDVNACG